MRKVTLLLTGTVRVGRTRYVKLTNSEERLRHYRDTIRRVLAQPGLDIVFCENSGADLGEIKDWQSDSFEILQFQGQGFDGELGKGYGEALIIEHALANSRLLADADLVVKISGRYFVHGLPALKSYLAGCDDLEVCCNLTRSLTVGESIVFAGSKRFFTEYFLPLRGDINDSKRVYFEHVLANATLSMIADHSQIVYHPMPFFTKIEGISGSRNRPHKNGPVLNLRRWIIARLKYVLIRR